MRQTLIRPAKKWGHTQTGNFMGNIGQGRHYDPTKHMTLEQMRKKSIVYQDVYLDGYENSYFADRNSFRILSPEGAKRARFYRSAFFNRRLFNYVFVLSLLGYAVWYIVFTFRYLGVGMRINNFMHERSDVARCEREAAAIENNENYIPPFSALVEGYKKLMAPEHLSGWANYEVKNEWVPIPDRTGHPDEDDNTIPQYSYMGFRKN